MSLFVTAFFDLFELEPARKLLFNHSADDYLIMFLKLLEVDINFYIFLDENFYKKNKEKFSPKIQSLQERGFFIKIVLINFLEIPYANYLSSLQTLYDQKKVFVGYNVIKDTSNFMALIYSKIDFVLTASQDKDCSRFDHYHWIDAGIYYLIPRYNLTYDFKKYLLKISHQSVNKITFCNMNYLGGNDVTFNDFFGKNSYYLCGGFFSVPKSSLGWFSDQMKDRKSVV